MAKHSVTAQRRKTSDRALLTPAYLRYCAVWRVISRLLGPVLVQKFNYKHESCFVEGPCIVVSNHITNWDPFLLALSFPEKPLYFVASEHIFRWGIVSRLIEWLAAPIPRSKGASGASTVLSCISRVRGGGSVALFAEGDCTWDGRSQRVVASTGKFIKLSKATLVTYRLDGLYLSLPRWGDKVRRGSSGGRAVGVYTPEQLALMSGEEINAIIERDIFEDALERQKTEPVTYKGGAAAQYMELAVFMCPQCSDIGTLSSQGDRISCRCGFSRRVTEQGFLDPIEPFAGVAQWDEWQRGQLEKLVGSREGEMFSDPDVTLAEIMPGHGKRKVSAGVLRQYPDSLSCGGVRFELRDISSMAIAQTKVLLFSCNGAYYELRPKARCCLRKYLMTWQTVNLNYKSEKVGRI